MSFVKYDFGPFEIVPRVKHHLTTAAGTNTLTALVKAGDIMIAGYAYNDTVLSDSAGLTTYSLGVTGDTNAFGSGLPRTVNHESDPTDWPTGERRFEIAAADLDVLLTAAAGTFAAGDKITVVVWVMRKKLAIGKAPKGTTWA